jgi:DNA-3-methyladenine glycosylase II/AraC family transcriptional regulator of adaptative response / DNA-3-methyladenine glycosylase II
MGFDHRVTSTLVDLRALRAFLAAHAVDGLDDVEVLGDGSSRHRRLVPLGDGHALLTVTVPAGDVGTPDVEVDGRPDAVPSAVDAGRRWVGLDADPSEGATALVDDPRLGPLVRARPHLRVPGSTDAFETAVLVVLGQHVSLAAGRLFAARLVAAHAPPTGVGELRSFPDPQVLAALAPEDLQRTVGTTGSRARTVVAVARAVADGSLDLTSTSDRDRWAAARTALLALPGVGAWTADLVALRGLRDPDVFLPGDLVLRRALGDLSAREAAAAAQGWAPYRSLAVLHLWTQHAIDPR